MYLTEVLEKHTNQFHLAPSLIGLILAILAISFCAIGIWMLFRFLVNTAIEGTLVIDQAPPLRVASQFQQRHIKRTRSE